MITMISAFISLLLFRFRARAGLELELVALRHQVAVLRRQRKGRVQLFSTDRLLWVWLYRIWPQALNAMVLVKPSTVVQLSLLKKVIGVGIGRRMIVAETYSWVGQSIGTSATG